MSQKTQKLSPTDLAALLCGRVCHDLLSPVSALMSAAEVLDDEDNADMHEDALELIKVSAKKSSAQLQFLRLAFGAATNTPGIVGLETLKELVDGVYGEAKQNIVWECEIEGLDKSVAKLLLHLISISLNTIPLGGVMTIQIEKPDALNITLTMQGPKARLVDMVPTVLSGRAPVDGFDGKSIQVFYAGLLSREIGADVMTTIDGDIATFTVNVPAERLEAAA